MKKAMFLVLMLFALAMAAGPAHAVSLSLQQVGATTSVNLVVGDLGNYMPASLGGFLVDVLYNPSLLSITDSDVTFGPYLGDPLLGEAYTSVDTAAYGVVDLYGMSLLPAATLDALQPGSFTLATLNFSGDLAGIGSLAFDTIQLTDGLGTSNFETVATPLPGALLLLAPGLIGIAGLRRRFGRG